MLFTVVVSGEATVGVVGVRAPQKFGLGVPDTSEIVVYYVTCNWSSSYVNLFNIGVSQFSPQNAPKEFGGRVPHAPDWFQEVGPRGKG